MKEGKNNSNSALQDCEIILREDDKYIRDDKVGDGRIENHYSMLMMMMMMMMMIRL